MESRSQQFVPEQHFISLLLNINLKVHTVMFHKMRRNRLKFVSNNRNNRVFPNMVFDLPKLDELD